MVNPKVSVIIPFYNSAATLGRCLDSVLGQSLSAIEVLCYDDGSNDGSRFIAETRGDGRVRIFHGSNRGAGHARNFCMQRATGDYIAFMDSDDEYYSPQSLEKLHDAARDSASWIVSGSMAFPDNDFVPYSDIQGQLKSGYIKVSDYQYNYGFMLAIYERRFIRDAGLVFPDLSRYQDPPFYLAAQLAAGGVRFIPEYVYLYRASEKSQAYYSSRRLHDQIRGMTLDLAIARDHGFDDLRSRVLYRLLEQTDRYARAFLAGDEEIEELLLAAQKIGTCPYEPTIPALLKIGACRALLAGNFSAATIKEQDYVSSSLFWREREIHLDGGNLWMRLACLDFLSHHDLRRAYEISKTLPGHFPASPLPLLHLSCLAERIGKMENAWMFAREAYDAFPAYLGCLERLFYLYLGSARKSEAARFLEEARLCPCKFGSVLDRMESAWAMSERDMDTALALTKLALKDHGDDLLLRLLQYELLTRAGMRRQAGASLADALSRFPMDGRLINLFLQIPPEELMESQDLLALGHCPASACYLHSHFCNPVAVMQLASSFGTPAKFMLNLFAGKLRRMPVRSAQALHRLAARRCTLPLVTM